MIPSEVSGLCSSVGLLPDGPGSDADPEPGPSLPYLISLVGLWGATFCSAAAQILGEWYVPLIRFACLLNPVQSHYKYSPIAETILSALEPRYRSSRVMQKCLNLHCIMWKYFDFHIITPFIDRQSFLRFNVACDPLTFADVSQQC